MSYIEQYLEDAKTIIDSINPEHVEEMVTLLLRIREKKGRLFFLGVGGSAANCSHAVNDFRKIAGFEAYTPVDNVAELTARTNDEGWETVFSAWLRDSNLSANDGIFIFSVGGGNREKNISANLVHALEYAKEIGAKVLGVVGRDGGFTAKVADACIVIPPLNPESITPQTEAFHGVIWHMIVSDPRIMRMKNKWESVTPTVKV